MKKFFIQKTVISSILIFSFGVIWINRETVLEDIFGPDPSPLHLNTCSSHGTPPTEWPLNFTY